MDKQNRIESSFNTDKIRFPNPDLVVRHEIESLEYLASTLTYDHQSSVKRALLLKADSLRRNYT